MEDCLKGQVSIVTGATKGIGRGIALGMAKAGSDIVVTARTLEDLEKVAEEIRALGRKALVIRMDAFNYDDLQAVVDGTMKAFGRIDTLVNNAGGSRAVDKGWLDLMQTPAEALEGVFKLNCFSPVMMSQYTAKEMIKQGWGNIINITSPLAVYTSRVQTYTAAKAALNEMTKLWAVELGPYNIRVNAILPGPIEGGTLDKFMTPELREARAKILPMRRIGLPEDVAPAAVFLASAGASWISGATLLITGAGRGQLHSPDPDAFAATGKLVM